MCSISLLCLPWNLDMDLLVNNSVLMVELTPAAAAAAKIPYISNS